MIGYQARIRTFPGDCLPVCTSVSQIFIEGPTHLIDKSISLTEKCLPILKTITGSTAAPIVMSTDSRTDM